MRARIESGTTIPDRRADIPPHARRTIRDVMAHWSDVPSSVTTQHRTFRRCDLGGSGPAAAFRMTPRRIAPQAGLVPV
ncbi:hypothetical protein SCOCK_610003 [Actinacidiphila cocklensis]|uniref:Uncharacterized protein n=1 Tax=Actinacidiphila cocklensis TaxID=887465 RepID=A0A9W4GWR0_9ACTN|nr:hypothetical protein SCOCK_610003 [Actinacidiphila cocklensis]